MSNNIFQQHLPQCEANYTPLSPLSFIRRTAKVFPEKMAIVHGNYQQRWRQTYTRCCRLALALRRYGIGVGDTVAVMAPNVPMVFEAHFGVPMSGAVLNALNVRLDADSIAYMLDHSEAKVLLVDTEFANVIEAAVAKLGHDILVIDYVDPTLGDNPASKRRIGAMEYEAFLSNEAIEGDEFGWQLPDDEWNAISLNYTSGTTGNPKGVVYHHRGAYLNAMSNIVGWNMPKHAIYLWTLPMFHCNGWCFPWSLAAIAGTNICMRKVDAKGIFAAIAEHGVTHFCGAPIILNFVINATPEERRAFSHTVEVMTAAAPPPATVLAAMEKSGFHMTHVYGLTETYGPAVICDWNDEWDAQPVEQRAQQKSRQGVPYHVLEDLSVRDPESMQTVPGDGSTMGETMFKGNIVMKGYLKNPDATKQAFAGGWFHSGDLGVMHADHYLQLKDRSKDIIISGGENISSIEVEDVLYRHPAVLEAAVVARPDDKWGETPCAFVTVKTAVGKISEQSLIAFCRENLAHYKAPKTVIFTDLPKTSTGKIQKFKLRARAIELGSLA